MTNINEIINTIDKSKMVTDYVDFYEMCENEFEIYEYIQQSKDNVRLTYCYYHRWICTDTEVGIRVWYFDTIPVCISWKPYRKGDEVFGWISEEFFYMVKDYAISLTEKKYMINVLDDETINNVVQKFNEIDYKELEVHNIK